MSSRTGPLQRASMNTTPRADHDAPDPPARPRLPPVRPTAHARRPLRPSIADHPNSAQRRVGGQRRRATRGERDGPAERRSRAKFRRPGAQARGSSALSHRAGRSIIRSAGKSLGLSVFLSDRLREHGRRRSGRPRLVRGGRVARLRTRSHPAESETLHRCRASWGLRRASAQMTQPTRRRIVDADAAQAGANTRASSFRPLGGPTRYPGAVPWRACGSAGIGPANRGGVRGATRSPAHDARAAPTTRARRGPRCAPPDRGG
jgi:hypothetical protein